MGRVGEGVEAFTLGFVANNVNVEVEVVGTRLGEQVGDDCELDVRMTMGRWASRTQASVSS
jgi:hypothetical protein